MVTECSWQPWVCAKFSFIWRVRGPEVWRSEGTGESNSGEGLCETVHKIAQPQAPAILCVLIFGSLWHHWNKSLHLHDNVNNRSLHDHISHQPTCLLESLIAVMLFYDFIQAASGSCGTEECLSSVWGKHYSSMCWHTPFLNHHLQTPRSINCWKYWRGSRDLTAATTRKYM